MIDPSVDKIRSVLALKGYVYFDTGDYNLNLIGVRKDRAVTNKFVDTIIISYPLGGMIETVYCPATTVAGEIAMLKPIIATGTAILKPGQYRGAYHEGMHKGSYRALVQAKPVTVYRDGNKDLVLDYENEETGFFGINIHRANPSLRSTQVDKWSYGCQVFADPQDFSKLMLLYDNAKKQWGNTVTYTLLEEHDFE